MLIAFYYLNYTHFWHYAASDKVYPDVILELSYLLKQAFPLLLPIHFGL